MNEYRRTVPCWQIGSSKNQKKFSDITCIAFVRCGPQECLITWDMWMRKLFLQYFIQYHWIRCLLKCSYKLVLNINSLQHQKVLLPQQRVKHMVPEGLTEWFVSRDKGIQHKTSGLSRTEANVISDQRYMKWIKHDHLPQKHQGDIVHCSFGLRSLRHPLPSLRQRLNEVSTSNNTQSWSDIPCRVIVEEIKQEAFCPSQREIMSTSQRVVLTILYLEGLQWDP